MKLQYNGIFAKDALPPLLHNGAYIANTGESHDIGEHWVLTYVKERQLYFIDSFAEPPMYYGKEFVNWIKSYPGKVNQLQQPLQHPLSHFCGLYVLFFFYHLSRNYSLYRILKYFSRNSLQNDRNVVAFSKKKFGKFKPILHKGGASSKLYKEKMNKDFSLLLFKHRTK